MNRRVSVAISVALIATIFSCCALSLYAQNELSPFRKAEDAETQARASKNSWSAEATRQSYATFVNAAEQWESVGELRKAVICLIEASNEATLIGDLAQASQALEHASIISGRARFLVGQSEIYSKLALLSLKDGNAKVALNYAELSRQYGEASGDPEAVAISYATLAELSLSKRNLVKAIEQYQKSLGFWEKTNNTLGMAETLVALSCVYMPLGEPLTGLEFAMRAEKLFLELNHTRGLALSRIAIGHLYSVMSQKQRALESYFKARDNFPDDIDFIEKARLMNGIGLIYENYGEFELSYDFRRQAFELFKRAHYTEGQLATLPSLIKLCDQVGHSQTSFQYYLQTKELSRNIHDEYWLAIAGAQIGDHYYAISSFDDALSYYNHSLKIVDRVGLRVESAKLLDRLGSIKEAFGQTDLAKTYFQRSLEISRHIADRQSQANTLYNLARLESGKGEFTNALQSIRLSVELTEDASSDVLNSILTSRYFSNAYDRFELNIHLLMRINREMPEGNLPIQALIVNEQARARQLRQNIQLSDTNLTQDISPDLLKREKELTGLLNVKRSKLTDLLSAGASNDEITIAEIESRSVENEVEDTRATLKQTNPIYSAIKNPEPFDPEKFQREVLDDDSLFLEFSLGKDESYLWVIGKREISYYTLPSRDYLESRVSKLLEMLKARERKPDDTIESYNERVDRAEQEYPAAAAELSRELLGPAAEKLHGKRLIVSPDGKMGYLPIGALTFPNSDSGEPLLVTNEIVYTPSASILSLIKTIGQKERPVPSKDLMVFADPVFSASDERLGSKEPDQSIFQTSFAMTRSADSIKALNRLPASQTEALSISEAVRSSTIASGFSASRERVLNADLGDYKVIHFATHGILNEQHPDLSGILLSLYDEKGSPSEGFIRAQDIYGLNLNADLVVLSACNTGVGKEVRGEGIMSLNTAFLQAGARSVVSSLWKVDDKATELLMHNFYGAMAKGDLTPAQALRHAQIKLMQDIRYRSPFYWAAFTAQGDIGTKVVFSSGRWPFLGFAFLTGMAGIILILALKRYFHSKKITQR